ncbi:hypothetical protein D0859_00834 [Hortaea werneckii]|uniref:Uncharacterized protein n=1 Tax=Hortaea werneckii TaxID=91943 RepID=A0A3M7JBD1_HORWE|nr:hypothetical protein D0859_00834 [Hortaea werneckii]
MSSISGGQDEGGNNEDVDADETTRTAESRTIEQGNSSSEDSDEDEEHYESLPEDSIVGDSEAFLDETTVNAESEDGNIELDKQDDGERLDAADDPVDERGLDVQADGEPIGSQGQSPFLSAADSGSIPDDLPSVQGSRVSSPGPLSLRGPRRTPQRTTSGALQPFEKRFESRFSTSPSPSSRAGSPAFLTPHSRQISISSQFSQLSSQASSQGEGGSEAPIAPWEVIRWTKLRKLSGQAFSESGKRNFGRPTTLAVSALIAVGTSKGLVLGFDYHQTLKVIIGQGTKATECGSVTALAIAADYSTIAAGHANGQIFTWDISKPARPFLQIPPLEKSVIQQSQHPDGHVSGQAILHIGFLGTRHTALVSADAAGMAFSHLATRGLGPVTRTVKTTRLLGRYPTFDARVERGRNVEQATDGMGLTALLTPYLLVIVSTTPIAQTQHKSPRPKEVMPHSTLSGCLAWFPAVKLKSSNATAEKGNSDTKLVYCWSNVLTVLDVKVVENDDSNKPPSLEFHARSRWRADEAIVAVQWLGRSVLGVITVSQRLLILEDPSLQVTDSLDLIQRHVYHQDLFSHHLQSVVDRLDSDDPSLHGVVADAFYMSFKAYKGRTFLLGFNDLLVGVLSNWADRLMALMENGDHIGAIRLGSEYYVRGGNKVTVGLPENDDARHEVVRERLLEMITASLNYSFSQQDDERDTRIRELADVCFDACISMRETEYLFGRVFEIFEEAEEEDVFVLTLEPYVLDGDVSRLPPEVVKSAVAHFISENQAPRLEDLLCRLDPFSFDLDEITMLCRQHSLYDALIYVWGQGIGDFVTPLIDMMSLIKILQAGDDDGDLSDNPFFESAIKVYPYLAYALTGRLYPRGDLLLDDDASKAKADLYGYVFAGTPTAWPPGSQRYLYTVENPAEEPAFPYLVMLLEFDAAKFMTMLNEAFEDPFLNEADDDTVPSNASEMNGVAGKMGYKMTRQHIISIMLDVMKQHEFDPDQVIYLDMFIARSLAKYPGQIVLSGALLDQVLQHLCHPPVEEVREDCQLSVEYLLSAYRPSDVSWLVDTLRQARFFHMLKYVYRIERLYVELLETYFEDEVDQEGVFDAIGYCLRPNAGATAKQLEGVKRTMMQHIQELANISITSTARTFASSTADLLPSCIQALRDSYQQFMLLRCLLEPQLIRESHPPRSSGPSTIDLQTSYGELYVQLLCQHDPTHVAEYINVLPTSNLTLNNVLPAMEEAGVVDAAVVLLARDGMVRDAMERLVVHLQTLQQALISMVEASAQAPDASSAETAALELVEDIEKYSKVGIWLCQGQSATAQRRPRPRMNVAWDVKEDDLDLDEYLWLNLVDAAVQVTKTTTGAVEHHEALPEDTGSQAEAGDLAKIITALRSNTQQTFTALLAATATPSRPPSNDPRQPPPKQDNLSFLRVLRAFLTRAATSAPSLADLRAVLSDIFSAYTFEQDVLSLANELLGSNVFTDIEEANSLRQRGWRPRTQVCESCKRRVWGQGIGETVWDEWVLREQKRESEKARKLVERGGGEEARRLERGKAKAAVDIVAERDDNQSEESRRMALVVFACRHVFHKACLDQASRDGSDGNVRVYRCPLCKY